MPVRTHHGYAVNVKDYTLYAREVSGLEELTDAETEALYDLFREQFWNDAEELGREYGFKNVYSAGRMGGWLKPEPQPATDDMPYEVEAFERRFLRFTAAVEELLRDYQNAYADELRFAVEIARQTARNNALALADWAW